MNENWILSLRVPFTEATRKENGLSDDNISGLGDVTLSATLQPWSENNSLLRGLSFSAGLILPTGEPRDNPQVGSVTAPSVFQLGTGTTQMSVGARYSGQLDDWSYFSSLNLTFPLYESSKDFRPAETVFFSAGLGRKLTENLSARLSADFFHGNRDEFSGSDIANTGSTNLSLTPSFIYSINDDISASVSVAIPIYREVNQTALAVGPLWSLGLSMRF